MNQNTFCFGFTSEAGPHGARVGLKLLMKLEGHRTGNIWVEHEAKRRNRKPPAYKWFAVQHVTWGIFHCCISTAPKGKDTLSLYKRCFPCFLCFIKPPEVDLWRFCPEASDSSSSQISSSPSTRCYRFQHPTQIVLVKQNAKSLHTRDRVRVLQGSAMTLLSDEPQEEPARLL